MPNVSGFGPLVLRGGRSEGVRVGHQKDVHREFAKELVRGVDGSRQIVRVGIGRIT